MKDLFKIGTLDRHDYLLAKYALSCLLERFNIVSNVFDNSKN